MTVAMILFVVTALIAGGPASALVAAQSPLPSPSPTPCLVASASADALTNNVWGD